MIIEHVKILIHPVIAGFCAFLATIVGSYSFKIENQWYIVAVGFIAFLMVNNVMYKLKFNSYNLNGVTLTTILIFISQSVSMLLWKGDQVKPTWILGVLFIIIGVTILQKNKQKAIKDINKQE